MLERRGEQIGLLDYLELPGEAVYTHIEVVPFYRGRGLAEELTRVALADASAQGLRVRALCPYVAAYLRRHPQAA